MFILLAVAIALGIATYFATFKVSHKWRAVTAAGVFVLLGVVPLIYVLAVGDQIPSDARLVTQEELQSGAKRAP